MSLGNHDYKEEPSAWLDIAKENSTIKFPYFYYIDIYKDICFITLDTNAYFLSQILWLKEFYQKEGKNCRSSIFIGHHPLYSSGSHGNAYLGVKIFLNLILSNKAHYYIAGHDHNLEDYGMKDGIRFLISGAAGEIRPLKDKPRHWAVSKPGYLKLWFEDQKVQTKFQIVN